MPGTDPRYQHRGPGAGRRALLVLAIVAGGIAGGWWASATVPQPNCAPEDRTCTLQRLYLAQAMKPVAGMLAGCLLVNLLFISAPGAVSERKRKRQREAYKAHNRAVAAQRTVLNAQTAKAALEDTYRPVSLPPAAMAALGRPGLGAVPARPAVPAAVHGAVGLPPAATRAAATARRRHLVDTLPAEVAPQLVPSGAGRFPPRPVAAPVGVAAARPAGAPRAPVAPAAPFAPAASAPRVPAATPPPAPAAAPPPPPALPGLPPALAARVTPPAPR